jgi:uncharacterized membrane protein YbhN (UPF0104 family)
MQRKHFTLIAVGLAVAVLLFTEALNALLLFLVAGVIPGTRLIVPYWVMMAAYCVLIAAIATPYLEKILKRMHQPAVSRKKTRLPNRRYGHIST